MKVISMEFSHKPPDKTIEKTALTLSGPFSRLWRRFEKPQAFRPELQNQTVELCAESLGGAGFGFCGFLFAISWRGAGFERFQEPGGCGGNFIDGSEKNDFVCLRRFVEACDFPHELQRRGPDLFRSDRRIEIVERLYISAHEPNSSQRF